MKITHPSLHNIDLEATKKQILEDAQRCVMCGMCSTSCPTYELSRDENESPRGRLTLIQFLLSGRIQPSASIEQHLDNCLMCGTCETICPSKVPYGDILNFSRDYLAAQKEKPHSRGHSLARYARNTGLSLTTQNTKIKYIAWLVSVYQHSGLQLLLRKTRVLELFGLAKWERLIPVAGKTTKNNYLSSTQTVDQQKNKPKKNVSLFTGCLAQIFDQQTLIASKNILRHCGYSVNIPEDQTCCGAIHEHNGDNDTAMQCAQRNIDAFSKHPENPVIFSASGCGASLSGYQKKYSSHSHINSFQHSLSDILGFLVAEQAQKNLYFKALDKKVLIHRPCLSRNILNITNQAEELLKHIPKLRLEVVGTNTSCCGSAGSHMISHPEHAAAIREKLLGDIMQAKPDILVSDNLGCVLHIQAGLRLKGLDIEVVHPVVLLDRQLQR